MLQKHDQDQNLEKVISSDANGSARQYFTLPGLFHVESMEGGMDCRNSRWIAWNGGWIPWNGGWIPWNGGWIPYFWWMDSYGMSSWNHNSTLIHKFKPKYWVV